MAPLPAYCWASLPLLGLGLWHLLCCSRSFLKSPRDFSAKTWHPFLPPFLHLELYLELLGFLLALVYQSVAFSLLPHSSAPQIFSLQQFFMLLLFFIVVLITAFSATTSALPLPSDAVFVLWSLAFSVERMVIHRVADPSLILERKCFGLLGLLAALCACSCLMLAWRPKAFVVNLVLCGCICLQGTWLMQIGLSLFSERFLPDGCHRLSSGVTQCDVDAAKIRAVALMDLAFTIHVMVMICAFSVAFGVISRRVGRKKNGGYGALEPNGESDHSQMRSLSTKIFVD